MTRLDSPAPLGCCASHRHGRHPSQPCADYLPAVDWTGCRVHRAYVGLRDQNGLLLADSERAAIVSALDEHLGAYTLFKAEGRWQGSPEPTFVVEVITYGHAEEAATQRAFEAARVAGSQSVVLVTVTGGAMRTLEGRPGEAKGGGTR